MKYVKVWKVNDRNGAGKGRTHSSRLVRSGFCKVITAWMLLFLMIGLSARGAEGKEMK